MSYRPASGTGRKVPELVFLTEPGVGERAEGLILGHLSRTATDYLEIAGQEGPWAGIQPNLFPRHTGREFGFDGCGYVQETETETEYHFPLAPETVARTALTIHFLAYALRVLTCEAMEQSAVTNRSQLCAFMTRCTEHADAGYGHAVAGDIYPAFRAWLHRYGREHEGTDGTILPAEAAMRETYASVAHPRAVQFADACRARINAEGRFLLECPGNACDLAIYPDADRNGDTLPVVFSCHNLDSAVQQVTLLAGLAVLHDMAAADLG